MADYNGMTAKVTPRGGMRLAIAVLMMMVAVACAPIYRNHGYVPTDEELARITVGKDTRDTVATYIGRPSAEGLLNDVGWYYVESRWKTFGALAPKEEQREVVAISFNDAGVVENVERFGLEKGQIVPISRRVTKENIKSVGLLRQLFGNIGGLSTDALVK